MKRKAKSVSGPKKKANQNTGDFQPNRVPVTIDTDSDTGTGATGGDRTPLTITPVRTTDREPSTITKPKQSLSFLTPPISLTTTNLDVDPPKPTKKQKASKDDLGTSALALAQSIMEGTEEGSSTYDYAQQMHELVTLAGMQVMKKFSPKQLTLMAKILLKRQTMAVEGPDQTVDELTATVRDYLLAVRPKADAYVLPGSKKKGMDTVSSKQQAAETSAWLDVALSVLGRDGFDDGGRLVWMRKNIDNLLKAIADGTATVEWAELRGYIFQINKTLAARSSYLLRDVELPITIPDSTKGRSVDSIELVFTPGEPEPALCFCEYKGYGTDQTPSKDLTQGFDEQLNDYVKKLSLPAQPCHLRYVFPGAAPDWVHPKLRAAAERLQAAGKKVYITEGSGTRVVGKEKNFFGKPTKQITTTTSTDPPVITPRARAASTPSVVVKEKVTPPKKKPPAKKKATKKDEEIDGQGKLDAFWPTAKVHPPASTPPPGDRPRSTSTVLTKSPWT
ncbi:hypothetical protein [Nonomuraea sp. NPDC005692]|uniref:hypothetical protein n=1 Tax=Nonomuraea sp. NPDC005692 TaxID=3157168 RepID=UPI00340A698B